MVTVGKTAAPALCGGHERSSTTITSQSPVSIAAEIISCNTPGARVDAHTECGASSGRRQRVGSIGQRPSDALQVTSWRLA